MSQYRQRYIAFEKKCAALEKRIKELETECDNTTEQFLMFKEREDTLVKREEEVARHLQVFDRSKQPDIGWAHVNILNNKADGSIWGATNYIDCCARVAEARIRVRTNDNKRAQPRPGDAHVYGELRDVAGLLRLQEKTRNFFDIGAGCGLVAVRMFLHQKMDVWGCELDEYRFSISQELCKTLFDLPGFKYECSLTHITVTAPWGNTLNLYCADATRESMCKIISICDLVLADIIVPPSTSKDFLRVFHRMKSDAKLVLFAPPQAIREGLEYQGNYAHIHVDRFTFLSSHFDFADTVRFDTSWNVAYPFYALRRR